MSESIVVEGRVIDKYLWGHGEMCRVKNEKGEVVNVEVRGESPKLMDLVRFKAAPGRFTHVSLSWERVSEHKSKSLPVADFDGETYSAAADHSRLNRQLQVVFEKMSDGAWRTLDELSGSTDFPSQSVSARLRDLRKPKFGGYTVARRLRGERARGLYEYRLEL